uniref:PDZ domain-containing protein n=1 Tax=Eutreptiella gymnastica TaxID=73025 RepID=A0A7S1HUD7_9EUGL
MAEREANLMKPLQDEIALLQKENQDLQKQNEELHARLTQQEPTSCPQMGLEVVSRNTKDMQGLEVVRSTGVAQASGICRGDFLIGIKLHIKANDDAELAQAMTRIKPGDVLTMDVNRRGTLLAMPLNVPNHTYPPNVDVEERTVEPSLMRLADRPMFQFPLSQKIFKSVAPLDSNAWDEQSGLVTEAFVANDKDHLNLSTAKASQGPSPWGEQQPSILAQSSISSQSEVHASVQSGAQSLAPSQALFTRSQPQPTCGVPAHRKESPALSGTSMLPGPPSHCGPSPTRPHAFHLGPSPTQRPVPQPAPSPRGPSPRGQSTSQSWR